MLERARKFFSSSFGQPLGTQLGEGSELRGYYIDLRVKPWRPDFAGTWPYEPGKQTWIALAQIALGAHELWLAGEGEEWLGLARDAGDWMLEHQIEGGPRDGAWEQRFDLPHTYELKAPWISAMAQGEAASLLVRLHAATGEERYAGAALRALRPMAVPMEEGGTSALLGGRPFPQEYPTTPASHVLNGALYAIWGWYDVAQALGDTDARQRFEDAVDTLAANLHRWDTGSWSRYDLYPHRIRNWSSLAYHELHVSQLRATHAMAPRPELAATAERWERHAGSKASRVRALAHKSAFRVLVPRG